MFEQNLDVISVAKRSLEKSGVLPVLLAVICKGGTRAPACDFVCCKCYLAITGI